MSGADVVAVLTALIVKKAKKKFDALDVDDSGALETEEIKKLNAAVNVEISKGVVEAGRSPALEAANAGAIPL